MSRTSKKAIKVGGFELLAAVTLTTEFSEWNFKAEIVSMLTQASAKSSMFCVLDRGGLFHLRTNAGNHYKVWQPRKMVVVKDHNLPFWFGAGSQVSEPESKLDACGEHF